nr:exocyst complex component EXO70B1-like isoform X2 [Ipomoea batatas]
MRNRSSSPSPRYTFCETIAIAEPVIRKWDLPASATFAGISNLLRDILVEAKQFLRCVDDLQPVVCSSDDGRKQLQQWQTGGVDRSSWLSPPLRQQQWPVGQIANAFSQSPPFFQPQGVAKAVQGGGVSRRNAPSVRQAAAVEVGGAIFPPLRREPVSSNGAGVLLPGGRLWRRRATTQNLRLLPRLMPLEPIPRRSVVLVHGKQQEEQLDLPEAHGDGIERQPAEDGEAIFIPAMSSINLDVGLTTLSGCRTLAIDFIEFCNDESILSNFIFWTESEGDSVDIRHGTFTLTFINVGEFINYGEQHAFLRRILCRHRNVIRYLVFFNYEVGEVHLIAFDKCGMEIMTYYLYEFTIEEYANADAGL